ncbi:MAG: ribonuclease PH [bacterium]
MATTGRKKNNQIRPLKITRDYLKHAEGSVLIESGNTKVLCAVSVDEKVPPFLRDSGNGWVTAEYSMLPRSTNKRMIRDRVKMSGRTYEIQRLIGRALRSCIDLKKLGERTIVIDCDVIQADGGTRTTAINGAFIALADAIKKMKKEGKVIQTPLKNYIAAISVGKSNNSLIMDLNYEQDSSADVDMNIVMNDKGEFIEIQGTSEKEPFSKEEMKKLLSLAEKGIKHIISIQKKLIGKL